MRRKAFTLLELLVVMGIILTLAGISFPIIGGLLNLSREANTKSTLHRLQVLNDHQEQRYQRLIQRSPTKVFKFLPQAVALVGKAQSTDLKELVARKLAYKDYMAVLDTQEDFDVPQVDGWGNPIRRYVWPTRLFRSGGTGTAITTADLIRAKQVFKGQPIYTGNLTNDLSKDPDDPLQLCVGITGFEDLLHTPQTFHICLFVSAGQDGQLGLYEPTDTANYGNLAAPIAGQDSYTEDNLYSVYLKGGGL